MTKNLGQVGNILKEITQKIWLSPRILVEKESLNTKVYKNI